MATHAITDLAIVLKPHDDVAIAKREIAAGTVLEDADGRIEARQDIRPGHKIARRAVRPGDAVRRYGQIIGFATAEIAAGDHVHTQNLAVGDLRQDYEFCTDVQPVDYYPTVAHALFRRVQARGRPGRDAQLRRDHLRRQLLRQREPVREGQVPRRAEGVPERRRRARDHAQVGLRHQALRRGPHGAAARPRRLRQAPERGGLHPDRTRLRGESGGRHGRQAAHGRAGPSRAAAVRHQYPGGRAASGGRWSARRSRSPSSCPSPMRRCGRRSRCRSWCSPPIAAAPTAARASPPTRPSAGPWTSWSATAAPGSSRKRRRSTAPSIS